MTFLEFKTLVYKEAFPQKDSTRLDARHEGWIKDCLIEIQQKVKCLQENHREYIMQEATYYSCGSTAFPIPAKAYIKGLRVQQTEDPCSYVEAVPYTEVEFRGILQRIKNCFCSPPTGSPDADYAGYAYDYGEGDPELRPATDAIDLTYTPKDRAFAIFEGNVWLWPVLNSDQTAILKWSGVKKAWSNTSVIPWVDEDSGVDREVVQLVRDFVLERYYQFDDCDPERSAAAGFNYRKKVSEMITECKRKQEIASQPAAQVQC